MGDGEGADAIAFVDAKETPLFAAYALRRAADAAIENAGEIPLGSFSPKAEEARGRCGLAAFALHYLADEVEMARLTNTTAPFHVWAREITGAEKANAALRSALKLAGVGDCKVCDTVNNPRAAASEMRSAATQLFRLGR